MLYKYPEIEITAEGFKEVARLVLKSDLQNGDDVEIIHKAGKLKFLFRDSEISHKINVSETISLTENLFNYKRWFNGLKKFSAIKLIPPFHR